MKEKVIIGSRGSDLALYQANFIKDILQNKLDCEVEIKVIVTSGDRIDHLSFDKMEGKGFFTKEIEDELLNKNIDLAVHSLKDLMTTQPDGLKLGAVGFRVDRRELLLINKEAHTGEGVIPVKKGGVIGTSSPRRKCQIVYNNQHLEIKDLRGNVPTRIRKLREGLYDAIIIATAGVDRLELDISDLVAIRLDAEQFLPAPAQGILGLQIRSDDHRVETLLKQINDDNDAKAAALERGLLAKYDTGCSLPLGVYSKIDGNRYRIKAVLGVENEKGWAGLRQVDLSGDDIKQLVDQAYDELNKGAICPVLE